MILMHYVPVFLGVAGIGLLAYVTYRLGLIQAYIAYWSEASKNTGAGTVSAKRAVFTHASGLAGVMLVTALAKAGWKFTPETLEAFKAYLYVTVGGYVGGKVMEFVSDKIAPKGDPQ